MKALTLSDTSMSAFIKNPAVLDLFSLFLSVSRGIRAAAHEPYGEEDSEK